MDLLLAFFLIGLAFIAAVALLRWLLSHPLIVVLAFAFVAFMIVGGWAAGAGGQVVTWLP